ncbi:hypothetical protein [Spiroplasma clarkii]|uniref:DinB/UmuC family translesion DNA polymerase n=1 Tax=Spiroplasma clarkii TaxID=2139 RepID=UPI0011BA53D3|nr:hypothetical protein [Spiroplasma clarkii]
MKELNLSCSIGISTNKFLAKTCVNFNKPYGISQLLIEDVPKLLWPMPVKKMHMIGPATEKTLNINNIFTIYDLAHAKLEDIQLLLGKKGFLLWNWANGIGIDEVHVESNELKSIGNELTLNFPTNNNKEIEDILYELSLKVSDRSKKRYLKGRTITVVIKYRRQQGVVYNWQIHKK